MHGSVLLCEKTTQRRCWGRRGFVRAVRHAGREPVAYSYELLTVVSNEALEYPHHPHHPHRDSWALAHFPSIFLVFQQKSCFGRSIREKAHTVPIGFGEFTFPWPSHVRTFNLSSSVLWESLCTWCKEAVNAHAALCAGSRAVAWGGAHLPARVLEKQVWLNTAVHIPKPHWWKILQKKQLCSLEVSNSDEARHFELDRRYWTAAGALPV